MRRPVCFIVAGVIALMVFVFGGRWFSAPTQKTVTQMTHDFSDIFTTKVKISENKGPYTATFESFDWFLFVSESGKLLYPAEPKAMIASTTKFFFRLEEKFDSEQETFDPVMGTATMHLTFANPTTVSIYKSGFHLIWIFVALLIVSIIAFYGSFRGVSEIFFKITGEKRPPKEDSN